MQNQLSDKMLLWENGIHLSNAAFHYAPAELREKWKEARKLSGMKAVSDTAGLVREKNPDIKFTFSEFMQPAMEVWAISSSLKDKCEDILRKHLKSGALRTFAFENPRSLSAPVLELPARLWHSQYKLDVNKLKFESITYLEIRVIALKRAATVLGSNLPLSGEAKQIGRPSYKTDVEKAFLALLQIGKINISAPSVSHNLLIREWMIVNTPNPKYGPETPGYDLIRRTIKPLIEAEQKKQSDKL